VLLHVNTQNVQISLGVMPAVLVGGIIGVGSRDGHLCLSAVWGLGLFCRSMF